MQDFKLAEKFDFIFIGFNSFLHNLTDKDALNCLRCVREHLNNDGIFLLSIFLPDPEFLYRDEYLHEARTFFNYKGKQCRVLEKNSYDDETQINSLTWQLEINGKLSDEIFSFQTLSFYIEMNIYMRLEPFLIIKVNNAELWKKIHMMMKLRSTA